MRPEMTVMLALAIGAAAGCSDPPPLERSCDGEVVAMCAPYAYAIVDEATLMPNGVEVGDPMAMVQVHVVMRTCGERAPDPHQVRIKALAFRGGLPDAGSSEMLFSLGSVTDDDGDGTIDVSIENPFGAEIPTETDLNLIFEPFSPPSCTGAALEGVAYRTGPAWMP